MQSQLTGVKTIFFHPSLAPTSSLVHVFSHLRHGEYRTHPLGYIELCCDSSLHSDSNIHEVSSKLTAVLSIHLDDFLSLTIEDCDEDHARLCARFSHMRTSEDIAYMIKRKAEDIIDTLLALGEC
ncbi:MAG: hypothetical protein EAY65_04765 [Alphaproteobacteria bacterium]|nr:MAG: hypothetical protein EAY65_04765 [Alphaproteobacteria bacterium]